MRKNPSYTALLRPTRLLISEKSATYTIKWSYTIIWQVRVLSCQDFFFLSKSICLKISCKIPELIIGFGEHYLVSSFSCISHQFLKYLSTTSKKKSFVNCKWPPGLVRKSNFPASILFTVSNNQFQNLNIF